METFLYGFLAGIGMVLAASVGDNILRRKAEKKRFDAEVKRVVERDLTYRSQRR